MVGENLDPIVRGRVRFPPPGQGGLALSQMEFFACLWLDDPLVFLVVFNQAKDIFALFKKEAEVWVGQGLTGDFLLQELIPVGPRKQGFIDAIHGRPVNGQNLF